MFSASDCSVNLFILVDSSSSVDFRSWGYQSNFIIKFLKVFGSGSNVKFLTYTDKVEMTNIQGGGANLINYIENFHPSEGVTDTAFALDHMNNLLLSSNMKTHSTTFFFLSKSSK